MSIWIINTLFRENKVFATFMVLGNFSFQDNMDSKLFLKSIALNKWKISYLRTL